jgi:transcription initiation factor TFIID subunit TAF12
VLVLNQKTKQQQMQQQQQQQQQQQTRRSANSFRTLPPSWNNFGWIMRMNGKKSVNSARPLPNTTPH